MLHFFIDFYNYLKSLFCDWRGQGSSKKTMLVGSFALSCWILVHQELAARLDSGVFTIFLVTFGGLAAYKLHIDSKDKVSDVEKSDKPVGISRDDVDPAAK